jgi:preprotein translocase subunit SecG
MEGFLNVALLIVSVLLIILTLLQSGKSEGASGAITGGNMKLFSNVKERGSELIASRFTLIMGIAFFVIAIFINLLTK